MCRRPPAAAGEGRRRGGQQKVGAAVTASCVVLGTSPVPYRSCSAHTMALETGRNRTQAAWGFSLNRPSDKGKNRSLPPPPAHIVDAGERAPPCGRRGHAQLALAAAAARGPVGGRAGVEGAVELPGRGPLRWVLLRQERQEAVLRWCCAACVGAAAVRSQLPSLHKCRRAAAAHAARPFLGIKQPHSSRSGTKRQRSGRVSSHQHKSGQEGCTRTRMQAAIAAATSWGHSSGTRTSRRQPR